MMPWWEIILAAVFVGGMVWLQIRLDRQRRNEIRDRIEGLEADLFNAVETAYRRGAHEWARLNYPMWIDRLDANQRAEIQGLAQDQNNV